MSSHALCSLDRRGTVIRPVSYSVCNWTRGACFFGGDLSEVHQKSEATTTHDGFPSCVACVGGSIAAHLIVEPARVMAFSVCRSCTAQLFDRIDLQQYTDGQEKSV